MRRMDPVCFVDYMVKALRDEVSNDRFPLTSQHLTFLYDDTDPFDSVYTSNSSAVWSFSLSA